MRRRILALTLAAAAVLPLAMAAGEKASVTFLVSMSCENCKNRIEKNLAYEKGVKNLEVDLSKKTVTIEYDTEKTTPDDLKSAIQNLGYTATTFKPRADKE